MRGRALSSQLVKPFLGRSSVRSPYGADVGKAVQKLRRIIHHAESAEVAPFEFGAGVAAEIIKADVCNFKLEDRNNWNELFHHLSIASGSRPSKKFIDTANKQLGKKSVRRNIKSESIVGSIALPG
jgi:hypothetical protein